MKYKLIIPTGVKPIPTEDEQKVAITLAGYFKRNVEFVKRGASTTPDIKIGNIYWEIKSPRGNSKYTIMNNIHSAKRQSVNIVINLARTKITSRQAVSRAKETLRNSPHGVKHLLIITKYNKIIDIK